MGTNRFCRYELRTTDLDAARGFYPEIVGTPFWRADVSIASLSERAAARGAPAHWLGHIGVGDVERVSAAFVEQGGQPLGPAQRASDGSSHAALRDPFGAVVGINSEAAAESSAAVAWHSLHVQDHDRALAFYSALFGWTASERLALAPELGQHQAFSWYESGESVGSISDAARLPHIHPHWLFHFVVTDIEVALGKVRARGGKALGPTRHSNGDLVAVCDDAQGAAFGLYQFAHSAK